VSEVKMAKALDMDLEERVKLFRCTMGFQGIPDCELEKIAHEASVGSFEPGEAVFFEEDRCGAYRVVAEGLVRVSIGSSSGNRMTYLLAGRGEPLNLVGPFTGLPRLLSAEAVSKAKVVFVKRDAFLSFAFRNPQVMINVISILGKAVDSANGRVLDMWEKPVEERLLKVLYTLYRKFGVTLFFTSRELAELAGTTPESVLRAIGRLRGLGIVSTARGKLVIRRSNLLAESCENTLWI
jgi:CRP-like cAMP-binding protein